MKLILSSLEVGGVAGNGRPAKVYFDIVVEKKKKRTKLSKLVGGEATFPDIIEFDLSKSQTKQKVRNIFSEISVMTHRTGHSVVDYFSSL